VSIITESNITHALPYLTIHIRLRTTTRYEYGASTSANKEGCSSINITMLDVGVTHRVVEVAGSHEDVSQGGGKWTEASTRTETLSKNLIVHLPV
jgi:hypothetical protein